MELTVTVIAEDQKKIVEALLDLIEQIEDGFDNQLCPDNGQGWKYDYDLVEEKNKLDNTK